MTVLEILLILTNIATLSVGAFYVNRIMKKVEFYEEWIMILKSRLKHVYDAIKLADIRGSFEADDEVGVVFRNMKSNIDDLEKFTEGE